MARFWPVTLRDGTVRPHCCVISALMYIKYTSRFIPCTGALQSPALRSKDSKQAPRNRSPTGSESSNLSWRTIYADNRKELENWSSGSRQGFAKAFTPDRVHRFESCTLRHYCNSSRRYFRPIRHFIYVPAWSHTYRSSAIFCLNRLIYP